jgi:hypothetical protein
MPPSSEQYAQLAALFTTGEDSPVTSSIELLLPAHLPVQGGLWLVPYAGRAAGQGISMLVRMHEETIDVAAIGTGSVDFTGCTSIEEIISRMHDPISNWIVQPPSDADPTSLLHCDADCVTLLSGADQAAVVGAYRLLKGLITATGESQPLPPIRLVIVGTEERASSDAASRIIQTAHHQLGVHIEVGQPLPAMGSTSNVISQVSFARSSNVVDFMSRLRVKAEEALAEDEMPISHRFELPQETVEKPQVEPTQDIETPSIEEPVIVNENTQQSFTSYVDGLLAITPRCPEHEHVELAVDSNGCLHVLANAEDFRDAAIVSGWTVRHREIISLACGGLQIDQITLPVQHLFTSEAVSVADLHGSGVRLHLLTEIEVEGNTGMFSTALN